MQVFFVKRRKYRESMRVLDASVIGLNQYHTDGDEEEKKEKYSQK